MSLKSVDEARFAAETKGRVFLAAAATLALYQQYVHATGNTANGSFTVTLPPVAAAKGLTFNVTVTIANSKIITLADQDDSEDWSDLTLDADDDSVTVYSDGHRWHVIENAIA